MNKRDASKIVKAVIARDRGLGVRDIKHAHNLSAVHGYDRLGKASLAPEINREAVTQGFTNPNLSPAHTEIPIEVGDLVLITFWQANG